MKNPDRVDLQAQPNGLVVIKYWRQDGHDVPDPAGATLYPAASQDAAAWGLMAAVDWLVSHGYAVRIWPYGARAFKDDFYPIRNAGRIIGRRRDVEREAQAGRLPQWFAWGALDFAFDM